MDFNRIDGECWWNRFADQTSKDVILQFDTGNASEMEGVTAQSLIKRNAGVPLLVDPIASWRQMARPDGGGPPSSHLRK